MNECRHEQTSCEIVKIRQTFTQDRRSSTVRKVENMETRRHYWKNEEKRDQRYRQKGGWTDEGHLKYTRAWKEHGLWDRRSSRRRWLWCKRRAVVLLERLRSSLSWSERSVGRWRRVPVTRRRWSRRTPRTVWLSVRWARRPESRRTRYFVAGWSKLPDTETHLHSTIFLTGRSNNSFYFSLKHQSSVFISCCNVRTYTAKTTYTLVWSCARIVKHAL